MCRGVRFRWPICVNVSVSGDIIGNGAANAQSRTDKWPILHLCFIACADRKCAIVAAISFIHGNSVIFVVVVVSYFCLHISTFNRISYRVICRNNSYFMPLIKIVNFRFYFSSFLHCEKWNENSGRIVCSVFAVRCACVHGWARGYFGILVSFGNKQKLVMFELGWFGILFRIFWPNFTGDNYRLVLDNESSRLRQEEMAHELLDDF